jgi:hypothetical protein
LEREEKRRAALQAAFPGIEIPAASLTSQYEAPAELRDFRKTQSRISQIKLELIRRGKLNTGAESLKSQEQSASGEEASSSKRRSISGPSKKCDPEVAKRRALVELNLDIHARELCEIFDRENVPLPTKWQAAGFKTWAQAYRHSKYRNRIDVLIAKDRRGHR